MGDDDDVELDEQTLRLLRLREAEIAAGRAKLTKPITSDQAPFETGSHPR